MMSVLGHGRGWFHEFPSHMYCASYMYYVTRAPCMCLYSVVIERSACTHFNGRILNFDSYLNSHVNISCWGHWLVIVKSHSEIWYIGTPCYKEVSFTIYHDINFFCILLFLYRTDTTKLENKELICVLCNFAIMKLYCNSNELHPLQRAISLFK